MSKNKKKTSVKETSSVTSQQNIPSSSAPAPTQPLQPSKSKPPSATTTTSPPPPPPAVLVAETSHEVSSLRRISSEADVSPDHRHVMEDELTRMREELSRATTTCEKHQMEAARAGTHLQHCKEELARISAVKTEMDHENRKLQAEVSSMEREKSRLLTQVERLKEDLQRARTKLSEKKKTLTDLKKKLQITEDEKTEMERNTQEREQTWQTIRRDVSSKRDDAIRETCKIRRENEKLKSRIARLKSEKSSILLRIWEKKQTEDSSARFATSGKFGSDAKEMRSSHSREDAGFQAKILSLELQLFRQARLVELLLDVIQSYDPQFTVQQRRDLTSAFADAGSIPELMSRKVTFA